MLFELSGMHITLGPLERRRVFVPRLGESVYGLTDLSGAGGTQVPQYGLCQDAEPDLNLVQPGSVRGRVVEVHRRMPSQPAVVLRFVGNEIVQHYVEFGLGIVRYHSVHEVQELPAPLAPVMGHLDQSSMHLQSSEEGCGSVPLVLVDMPSDSFPVRESQPSLGSLQGLDRGFLIDADHHGILGRVQVQPHNVRCLLGKLRISAQAPTATTLKMNAVFAQDPPNLNRRHVSQGRSHQLAGPRRVPVWRPLVQLGQDPPLGGLVVHPRLARPRRVSQTRQTMFSETGTPLAHGGWAHVQRKSDLLSRVSRRGSQHDTGSLHQALLCRGSAYPSFQRRSLLFTQLDRRCYSRHNKSIYHNAVY